MWKNLFQKIKIKSGLKNSSKNEHELITEIFGSENKSPTLTIFNDNEKQFGFRDLYLALKKLIRNPAAHKPVDDIKINKQDALSLLSTMSYMHRKLDKAQKSDHQHKTKMSKKNKRGNEFGFEFSTVKVSYDKKLQKIKKDKTGAQADLNQQNRSYLSPHQELTPTPEALKEYIEKLDQSKNSYKKLKNVYQLKIYIKAKKHYDEKIDVEVKLDSGKFIDLSDLKIDYPGRPQPQIIERLNDRSIDYSESLSFDFLTHHNNYRQSNQSIYTNMFKEGRVASCTLAYLKVDKKVPVFKDGLLISNCKSEINLNIKINSIQSLGNKNYSKKLSRLNKIKTIDIEKIVETNQPHPA